MNLTDRIESLLKSGVVTLTIGVSPSKMLYVQAKQGVKTGPGGTFMEVQHQAEAVSLVECVEQVSRQVEHANNLKTGNMIQIPRQN